MPGPSNKAYAAAVALAYCGIVCSKSWEHYRWDPVTNTHIKENRPWDPRDPDGSIAARAARDKKIAETEAEIGCLQLQLEALKKT